MEDTGNDVPFVIERIYDARISKVWKAISNREDMKQWYFDLAAFKPEVGFEFSFEGGDPKGEQYNHVCKVTQVVSGRKLAYSWQYEKYEGYSEVTFELFGQGERPGWY